MRETLNRIAVILIMALMAGACKLAAPAAFLDATPDNNELLKTMNVRQNGELWSGVVAGTLPSGITAVEVKFDDVVCYCRLSHRATMGWMALTHIIGFTNVKIYDGSWTEWGSIVGYPIER